MSFGNSPLRCLFAALRCARFGAPSAVACWLVLLAAPNAFAQVYIQDTFSGPNANSLVGQAPDTTNLPGGTWQGASYFQSASYTGSNQVAVTGQQTAVVIATSGNSFTLATSLTLSAGLETGTGDDDNGDPGAFRGIGLGYFSAVPPMNNSAFNNFSGVALDMYGNIDLYVSNYANNSGSIVANVPWPTAALGAFSQTTMYNLSYNVNTTTGQISGVSLSNGTAIDTADFTSLDSTDTTGVFSAANTAYVGLLQCSAYGDGTSYASNFVFSATTVPGIEWVGSGTAGAGSWADPKNWTGGVVPGLIAANDAAATSTDGVLFDAYNSANAAPVVDAGRNVQNITFDNNGGNLTSSITLGTAAGHALLLTSGGTIQTTGSVNLPQNVNAPLVLEGGGTYTFLSGALTSTATLNFGGPITAGIGSTATLALAGLNNGANTISGAIGDGSGNVSLSVTGANWVLTAANTYSGSTTVSNGALQIGSGGSLNPASAISVKGGSMVVASGGSLGAATIGVSGGIFTVASGATVGNAAIGVTGGTLAATPGSGTLSIGSGGGGATGATLSIAVGGAFSMVDGAIGVFNVQQGSSFGGSNVALTLGGGTLDFELSGSGADRLAVNVGAASVSGTNTIVVTPLGSSLNVGTYPLITAPGGLNSGGGSFQFLGGGQSTFVSAGASLYQLTLNNSAKAESVTVARATSTTIIQDTFSGPNGNSLIGQTPDTANLPGGAWQAGAPNNISSAVYNSPNQLAFASTNGAVEIPTSSAGYTPPATLTISAGLAVNDISANADSFGRGMGLGFFATIPTGSQPAEYTTGGFTGLTLDAPKTPNAGGGYVELNMAANNQQTRAVIVPFPTSVVGAFSTSTLHTLSYTINTTTGQISNVSLSNGTITDTADYAAIDNYNTSGWFTVANTAYAGVMNSAAYGGTGGVSNFVLSGIVVSAGSNWTGAAGDNTWATAGNWSGPVPGATSGTTNADTALFNQTAGSSPTVIDIGGRNVMNIAFDTAAISAMTSGTTVGPVLILTSGGTIHTTSTVANPQLINAPLVLEGNYTFTSGATSAAATLSFGGAIMPDALLTSAPTTLTLSGGNTGANKLGGALSDNGSAKLAVSVGGTGVWVYSGAANTYSGGTTIAAGATLELAGSVSALSQSMNIANSGSLLVASSTNQKVGTILGTGSVTVSSGSLTAYQIRQNSLTIAAGGKVTLSPSGSGTTTVPTGPNNVDFSSEAQFAVDRRRDQCLDRHARHRQQRPGDPVWDGQ